MELVTLATFASRLKHKCYKYPVADPGGAF